VKIDQSRLTLAWKGLKHNALAVPAAWYLCIRHRTTDHDKFFPKKEEKKFPRLPPGNADPQVGGNPLHNRNVAASAPNVRHYRFALLSGGNSGTVFGIESGGLWRQQQRSALMKKL
jgi:hypothetical protein